MPPMQWQTLQFPFTAGLDSKRHPYALEAPFLTRCQNVEFDEVGALRLRKPFATIGAGIYPSGTLSNVRKLFVAGDELCVFTSDTLYAWSETLSKWVSRGTHLAMTVSETPRFGNTSDQVFADRAQLANTIVYVWTEVQAGATLSYLAAIDATTGATIIAPTSLGATYTKPRVTATTTKIIVTAVDTAVGTMATAIDPAAPALSLPFALTVNANIQAYDVAKDLVSDGVVLLSRNAAGNTYAISRISAALAVTAATTKARTCDGIVAVSCDPGATRIQILRTDATNIVGDLLNATTLADVSTGTAIGTSGGTVNQLTGAHRTALNSGFYRCYVFWSWGETNAATLFTCRTNWVDTNNAIGVAGGAVFLAQQGVASRAFDYNGSVYVWTVFASDSGAAGMGTTLGIRAQLQNTYFLHRDDGMYVAKSTWNRAGGYTYTSGHLPGVAAVVDRTYAWAGSERQIITLGGTDHSGYGARSPRDVVFMFDDDAARRTVQLGRTVYVSGSPILQYDGEGLTEVGFEQYPWFFLITSNAGAGAIPAGAYSYKATLRWDNARGETERSTTATGQQLPAGAASTSTWSAAHLRVTRKLGSRRKPAIEMWRTQIAPTLDSPFYLTTSKDPSATGNNGYVESNDSAALLGTAVQTDNMLDAVLGVKEQNPENASPLVRMAPPPATIIAASDSRVYLAGIAGSPYTIAYSLQRGEGEIAAFNSTLAITLPSSTGPITGLALLNETLVAFTATAVYVVPGDGFDNALGGSNYGPARIVSTDVGATSADSIAVTPDGLVFFSRKGWYKLGRGWDLSYIGGPVESFNGDIGGFVASQVVESQHQIRVLSGTRMLTWDYLVNQWSEWSQSGGRDLVMWRGSPMLLDTAVKKEQTTFSAVDYLFDVEMPIKLNGPLGSGRVRWVEILGAFKADCGIRLRLARDYAASYFDDRTFVFQAVIVGDRTVPRHGPSQQKCGAYKVRVTIQATDGLSTPAFDAVTLVGLALEVGIRPTLGDRVRSY